MLRIAVLDMAESSAPEKLRVEVSAARQDVALDKLREAIEAAMGADVPTEMIHKALLEHKKQQIGDGNGAATEAASVTATPASPPLSPGGAKAERDRRRNAARIAKIEDADADKRIDFAEFTKLVREREGHSDEAHLKALFDAFDSEGSGSIDVGEYLEFSLFNALGSTHAEVTRLIATWDEDKVRARARAARPAGVPFFSDLSALTQTFSLRRTAPSMRASSTTRSASWASACRPRSRAISSTSSTPLAPGSSLTASWRRC